MKAPDFSEFTFGYALTDNLVNRVLSGVRGVPLFPSLKEEGQAGKGYDVKIPRNSTPLFLQFKLPKVVQRHRNVWDHNLRPTYYRMHLMRGSHSSQHRSLLRLARSGKDVFYVAPEFHTRRELSQFHSRGEVPLHSAFFDPKDIGKLDDNSHHVAYKSGLDTCWICSDPRKLERPHGGRAFIRWLNETAHSARPIKATENFFAKLTDEIFHAALADDQPEENQTQMDQKNLGRIFSPEEWWKPVIEDNWKLLESHRERFGQRRFAGYVARLLFDCELVMVGHGEDI